MTTPGGGGGGDNEIVFQTRVEPGEDGSQVARNMGERAAAAFREAVESGGLTPLPPIDLTPFDRSMDHIEQRLSDARRLAESGVPATQTGGAGGGGGRPPGPNRLGTPDEFDENEYLAALRARREMALLAREEAAAQRLIAEAQERTFRSYAPNVVAGTYHQNIMASAESEAERQRQSRTLESPIGQLGARETAYETSLAVRRALGELTEGLRTVTVAAPAAARAINEVSAAEARLASLTAVGGLTRVGPGQALQIAQESQLAGRPTVRTDTGFAEVTQSGTLRAITEAEALARAESELAVVQESAAHAAAVEGRAIEELTNVQIRARLAAEAYQKAQHEGDASQQARALMGMRQANAAVEAEQRGSVAQQRGFLGNVWHGLAGPARGGEDQPGANAFLRLRSDSGEFLGAIARYQAAYAIIFGLSQGFSALMRSEVQAQDVMVEFSEATGLADREAAKFVNTLGDIGGRAGFSIAQSMTAATRGIFAFGNEIARDPATGERDTAQATAVGAQSAQAAAMAALITRSADANATQQALIATTRGFNLGAADQVRVLDAVTNAYQNYGAEIGDILQGLPAVAEVSRAAGLSIEQTANMISLSVSSTAMSGQGVASLFNRFIGNFNERPATRDLLSSMGVDATGTAGQVLENLAHSWDHLSNAQQQAVLSALGGHEVAKALLPILQAGDSLLQANARSYEGAGHATELYYDRLNNISGLVRTLGGDLQSLGHDLASTGFITVLGAGLEILHPFIRGMDDLLRVVGDVNAATHGWAVPLLEVAAVLSIIGRQMEKNLALQAAETVEAGAEAAARTEGAVASSVGIGGRVRAIGTGAAGLAGGLAGTAGVVVGLIAMTAAIGAVVESLHAEHAARVAAAAATEQLGHASTVDQFRAAASSLAAARVQQEHANSGFGGFFAASPADHLRPQILDQQGKYAEREADRLEKEQQALAGLARVNVFFATTGDRAADLANGLDAMSQAGVPAVRQIELVTEALAGVKVPGGKGPAPLEGVFGTETVVSSLVGSVTRTLADFKVGRNDIPTFQSGLEGPVDKRVAQGDPRLAHDILSGVDPEVVRKRITEVLRARHIGPTDIIDDKTQRDIANEVTRGLIPANLLNGDVTRRLNAAVRDSLRTTFRGASTRNVVPQLSNDEFNRFVNGDDKGNNSLSQRLQALAGLDDPRANNSAQARLRQQITFLRALTAQGHGGAAQVTALQLLHQSEADYVQGEVTRIERIRNHELQGATSPAQIASINARRVTQEVQTAIANEDPAGLLGILDAADDATMKLVRGALVGALAVARHAYEIANRQYHQIHSMDSELHGIQPNAPTTGVDAAQGALDAFDAGAAQRVPGGSGANSDPNALAQAQILAKPRAGDAVAQAAAARDAAKYALDHAKDATARAQAQRQYEDAQYAYTQAVAADTEAKRSAKVDSRDTLGVARTAVDNAKTALDATVVGTTAYYQALAQYHQAQSNYADVVRANSAAQAAANVRPGYALAAAEQSVNAALADLNAQFRGSEGYWQAVGRYRQEQYAYGQSLLAAQHEHRLLTTDQTDPVAVAQEELRAARANLTTDRRNHTGNLDVDMNDVAGKQARAEAAAFDQRLHDVEFAHNMGRLSDQAYLNYLNSEHDRLNAIGVRTRQQTEELQQIDQAIKAASDTMQGQFNIGDIKIPTIYEVRRSIALGVGTGNPNASYIDARQYSIDINGADMVKVKALMLSILGPGATGRTAVNRSKV